MSRFKEVRAGEQGFVLVWSALLLLPLLTLGFVLIGYGRANVSKLRAQFNAVNLASVGTLSSEFESSETLNVMAMLANAQGFAGAQPVETVQNLSAGLLIFNHNLEAPGENKVAVYQKYTLPPLTSLVSSLGSVKASGVAQTKPSKLHISVVLDYSRSLLADGSINDLLKAFGVIDPNNSNTPGPNGYRNPHTQQIEPQDYAQNALPGAVGLATRYHLGWNIIGPAVPSFTWTAPPTECIPGPENGCGGGPATHQGGIRWGMTDNFMTYKRAATVLVGVMAQMSRYLDVSILGAPIPERVWDRFMDLSQGGDAADPAERFEPLSESDNDIEEGGGLFPAWRWNEPTVSGLAINPNAPPFLSGTIDYKYTFENPKSPLTDDMAVSPTRILLSNISVAPRKAAKYFLFGEPNGRVYSFAKDPPSEASVRHFPSGESYYLPAIPSGARDPGDSFPFDPGRVLSPNGWLENELYFGFGWPHGAVPFLQLGGSAHPIASEFPEELAEVYEYEPSRPPINGSGPSRDNLAPLSTDTWKTGYWLCVTYDELDDGEVNNSIPCDGSRPFSEAQRNFFYSRARVSPPPLSSDLPTSPRCASGGKHPVCTGANGALLPNAFVWCIHGWPRCSPGGDGPKCRNPATGAIEVEEVLCDAGGAGEPRYPDGYFGAPRYRGRVVVPDSPTPIKDANLFYFLMDLNPTYGGTFHHNMVPNSRCEEFLSLTDGAGRCAAVFVTDGVPRGTDFAGQEQIQESRMLDLLSERMDRFTENNNARSFTWYLGKKTPLDGVIAAARSGNLNKRQAEIIDLLDYDPLDPADSPPPDSLSGEQCADFNTITWSGTSCAALNSYILPLYQEETTTFNSFKDIMDGAAVEPPNENRVWVEAKLTSDNAGMTGLGSDDPLSNPVLKSLRGLLATIKGARVLDR